MRPYLHDCRLIPGGADRRLLSSTERLEVCSCKPAQGDLLPSSVQHRKLTFAFVRHNRRAARHSEHENQQGIGLMPGNRLTTGRF